MNLYSTSSCETCEVHAAYGTYVNAYNNLNLESCSVDQLRMISPLTHEAMRLWLGLTQARDRVGRLLEIVDELKAFGENEGLAAVRDIAA